MENTCLICAEDFNGSKRVPITCEFCEFIACSTCCQRYVLDQESSICMNIDCQKEWTRKFVVNTFSKTWVSNSWKDMNAKVGVEKEKALFPATMGVIADLKAKDAVRAEIAQLQQQVDTLNSQKWRLQGQLINGGIVAEKSVSNGRRCPDPECRGYLSTQWKCGLCEKWACHECHVIKGDTRDAEHTCDPDTLATAQLLSKDTKPCPKCSTPIHKIEGCDQMWCTQCHTGFSWKRGTIENRVHNPHYYEWQRQNGGGRAPRNVGDFECGRDIADYNTARNITIGFNKLRTYSNTLSTDDSMPLLITKDGVLKIIRNTIHLHEVCGPRFLVNNQDVNQDARVKFITKEYDDKKFASIIHKNNKATAKKQDIFNVIQLQHQGVTDIIFRMIEALSPINNINTSTLNIDEVIHVIHPIFLSAVHAINALFKEIQALSEYSNNLLREHSITYQCKRWVLRTRSERQYDVFL
jgi:hypothetical protein